MKIRLLVIDDELAIRRFLRAGFNSQEIEVLEAATGGEGVQAAANEHPSVILLDLGLPDMDGVDVLRRIREWSEVPVIVVSAREREQEKVRALDAGADDYLTKPFSLEELRARVRASLRRSSRQVSTGESKLEIGDLCVDVPAHRVTVRGKEVHLTPIEFKLLSVLAKHEGKVVTHRQLLQEVWGPEYLEETHYLRVYTGQLRHKIERDPARPEYIHNEPGVGYRLALIESVEP